MTHETTKVGLVGCGAISHHYMSERKRYPMIDVVACADLDMDRARAVASEHEIPRACTVEQLYADGSIEIVLNLTTPIAHTAVNLGAIRAGKSVYCEKPLAVTREDGRKTLQAAQEKGVLIGCAPDTFLGGAHQMARKLIDDGVIGRPIGAFGCWVSQGMELWHPDPEFYYQAGSGPMFDAGPYCLTVLLNLLGPVRRVTGSAQAGFTERTIKSPKKFGKKIPVEIPTYITGAIDFAGGAVGTIITTFDVWGHGLPAVEIYGTEGSLRLGNPNDFGCSLEILRPGIGELRLNDGELSVPTAAKKWLSVEWSRDFAENSRGLGLADMACALRSGRKHRANGDLAFHFLDIAHAFHDASMTSRHVKLTSTCERPDPLPAGLGPGMVDE